MIVTRKTTKRAIFLSDCYNEINNTMARYQKYGYTIVGVQILSENVTVFTEAPYEVHYALSLREP